MSGALDNFLKKINFTNLEAFKDTEVTKVVVHKLDSTWTIYIKNVRPIDVATISELKNISKKGFDNVKKIDIEVENENFTDADILSYIKYYLEALSTKSPALRSLKGSNISVKNSTITIEVMNSVEQNLIVTKKDKILSWFDKMGLKNIEIETTINEIKREKVKDEIKNLKASVEASIKTPSIAYAEKKSAPVLEIKGEALFGVPFDESKIVPIKAITDEKRGVSICAYITEIRAIESRRSDYKIFTIKVSDGETPFTCKLFTTDPNVYQLLLKNLKEGSWYKWRGSVQNDSFLHTLVLTIRSIMECDEKMMSKDPVSKPKESIEPIEDYGFIPEYIPEDDPNMVYDDAAFFAFDDDVPMPEYDFVGIEESLPNTLEPSVPKEPVKKEHPKPVPYVETTDDDGNSILLGENIKGLTLEMRNVVAPINSCIFECKIFDIEFFESSKNNFKIITLKLTDKTDSYLAKIFTKDSTEYRRLSKVLKKNSWIKIEGQIKYDEYAKDLVMTARSIISIPSREPKLKDDAEVKRVELHSHTMMSQMDGVLDVEKYLDALHDAGYRAVAITDHDGAQSYPDAFHKVNAFNKKVENESDKFKVIYGTELTMIEDSVDIVTRPIDAPSIDATYCVFDFETTGFNAGGKDTIIEIGAVLIKNGEIIDKFDELVNPGHPLSNNTTEVTGITDEMLKDKDNEENAIKRFIEFFKDYPMVAHNAKFDVSFLEMAYKKYNLGEFTNCVIDTLELSRTLDNAFARHSLSALIKRYNIEWDEEHHHRADYDAEGTAKVLDKMIKKMYNQNIENIKDFNSLVSKDEIYKYGRAYHVNI